MIIGSGQRGTVRDNINRLKGSENNDNEVLGKLFRKEEYVQELPKVDMDEIDPDTRDVDDSEKEWKDFYK